MLLTQKLGLKKPQLTDDVQSTIGWLSENFQIIDDNYDEIITDINSFLSAGTTYQMGKKYWNRSVETNGYVGWVNTRTGAFAPEWRAQKKYVVGDVVTAINDNGRYFECVVSGTSCLSQPSFSTVSGSITYDLVGYSTWRASYVYNVNDIIIASNGNMSYYYKCIIAGTSSNSEPNWNNTEGTTIVDGSVQWYVYKTVQWKEKGVSCKFVPFGNINSMNVASLSFQQNYSSINKFSQAIGDGMSNSIVVNHNLGTQDVVVMIREANHPFSKIEASIKIPDENSILINFLTPPPENHYIVTIIG